jgi:hypothetical protein
MTSFFVVPTFVPPTLEQLVKEPDEVAIIVSQEAKITQEVRWIYQCKHRGREAHPVPSDHFRSLHLFLQLTEVREYNRDTEPLGVIAAQEELESEQDDGLTSDGGGSSLCCFLMCGMRPSPSSFCQPSCSIYIPCRVHGGGRRGRGRGDGRGVGGGV